MTKPTLDPKIVEILLRETSLYSKFDNLEAVALRLYETGNLNSVEAFLRLSFLKYRPSELKIQLLRSSLLLKAIQDPTLFKRLLSMCDLGRWLLEPCPVLFPEGKHPKEVTLRKTYYRPKPNILEYLLLQGARQHLNIIFGWLMTDSQQGKQMRKSKLKHVVTTPKEVLRTCRRCGPLLLEYVSLESDLYTKLLESYPVCKLPQEVNVIEEYL